MTKIPVLNTEYDRVEKYKSDNHYGLYDKDGHKVGVASYDSKKNIGYVFSYKTSDSLCNASESKHNDFFKQLGEQCAEADVRAEMREKQDKIDAASKREGDRKIRAEKRKAFFKKMSPKEAKKRFNSMAKEAKELGFRAAGKKGLLKVGLGVCKMAKANNKAVKKAAKPLTSDGLTLVAALGVGIVGLGLATAKFDAEAIKGMIEAMPNHFKILLGGAAVLGAASVLARGMEVSAKQFDERIQKSEEKIREKLAKIAPKNQTRATKEGAAR